MKKLKESTIADKLYKIGRDTKQLTFLFNSSTLSSKEFFCLLDLMIALGRFVNPTKDLFNSITTNKHFNEKAYFKLCLFLNAWSSQFDGRISLFELKRSPNSSRVPRTWKLNFIDFLIRLFRYEQWQQQYISDELISKAPTYWIFRNPDKTEIRKQLCQIASKRYSLEKDIRTNQILKSLTKINKQIEQQKTLMLLSNSSLIRKYTQALGENNE